MTHIKVTFFDTRWKTDSKVEQPAQWNEGVLHQHRPELGILRRYAVTLQQNVEVWTRSLVQQLFPVCINCAHCFYDVFHWWVAWTDKRVGFKEWQLLSTDNSFLCGLWWRGHKFRRHFQCGVGGGGGADFYDYMHKVRGMSILRQTVRRHLRT
jgi:hypothetical protein